MTKQNKTHVTVPGILDAIQTKKDRTLKLTFGTQELSPEENAALMSLVHAGGYVTFSNFALSDSETRDIPNIVPSTLETKKSPAERLRNVLWHVFDQTTDKEHGFEVFYKDTMEILIDHYKSKLN